jgi:hypothetical protein
MAGGEIQKTGAERLKSSTEGQSKNPFAYVADLFKLQIADKLIGLWPLSRGSRESMEAEAWVHAVGRYFEPERNDVIRLDLMKAHLDYMKRDSINIDGAHIEKAFAVVAPVPPTQVILRTPFDEAPEGLLDPITKRLPGNNNKKRG